MPHFLPTPWEGGLGQERLDADCCPTKTSRNILVQRVPYDDCHALALHACIARRQVDDKDKAGRCSTA